MKKEDNTSNVSSLEVIEEIQTVLGCGNQEAQQVEDVINKSKEFFATNSELGFMVTLQDIDNAMKNMECSAYQAARVLHVYQQKPKYMASISFSQIKEAANEMGCSEREATVILLELNMNNMQSLITCSKIKEATIAIDCNALDAERALVVLRKLPKTYSSSFDYVKIRDTKIALGYGSSAVDTIEVLKMYKLKENIDPEFSMGEIPRLKQQLGCTVENAVKILLGVQKFWTIDSAFPFSEIEVVKKIIGGEQGKLMEAFKIALQKEMYVNGIITKKEWQGIVASLHSSKFLNPRQAVELLKMTSDEQLGKPVESTSQDESLAATFQNMSIDQAVIPSNANQNDALANALANAFKNMKVAQGVNPSNATITNTSKRISKSKQSILKKKNPKKRGNGL